MPDIPLAVREPLLLNQLPAIYSVYDEKAELREDLHRMVENRIQSGLPADPAFLNSILGHCGAKEITP